MSSLYAFLHPEEANEEREVIISNRFKDESGKVEPFKIKAVTQAENDEITRKSRKTKKVDGMTQEVFDAVEYNKRLVVAATVFPDFSAKELCENYGTLDPLDVPGRMLKSGEYSKLLSEISKLSGFGEEDIDAKN
ncbi:MAG: phage portal protein [Eubacteriales bacterium]|nr:phage portal protein [Eubacteriales bacterium]